MISRSLHSPLVRLALLLALLTLTLMLLANPSRTATAVDDDTPPVDGPAVASWDPQADVTDLKLTTRADVQVARSAIRRTAEAASIIAPRPVAVTGNIAPKQPSPNPDSAPAPPPTPPTGSLAPARFVVPSGVVLHPVAQGETLSRIAARHGTTVGALLQTNRLNSDILMIAQPLFVRPGSSTQESVSLTAGPCGPNGAELLHWEQARWVFNVGREATIRHVASGLQFRVRYMGGSNHADCEPITARDTATLRKIAGGSWTWNPKAVEVHVGGRAIAASINFMPHGVQSNYQNGFDGHFCMHFWRSTGHASGFEDPKHQANVLRAANLQRTQLPAGL